MTDFLKSTYIRNWRKARGLTMEELAQLSGMNQGNLSKLERALQPYTQANLEKIANALEVTPATLLEGDPNYGSDFWGLWTKADDDQRDMIIQIVRAALKKNM